jgi:hypothetical protein
MINLTANYSLQIKRINIFKRIIWNTKNNMKIINLRVDNNPNKVKDNKIKIMMIISMKIIQNNNLSRFHYDRNPNKAKDHIWK